MTNKNEAEGELDQAEIDHFKRILPGLAMSMSEIPEIREQGLKVLEQSLSEFDSFPLLYLRERAFIKAHAEICELMDADHERRQKEWDALCRYWKQSTRKRASRRPRLRTMGAKKPAEFCNFPQILEANSGY